MAGSMNSYLSFSGEEETETKSDSEPLSIQFPLPEHKDPSICRDTFINEIVNKHDQWLAAIASKKESTVKSVDLNSLITHPSILHNEETMMVQGIERLRTTAQYVRSLGKVEAQIAEKKLIMEGFYTKLQKAAIDFLSVRLLKMFRILRGPWPGSTKDLPNNLFRWSLEYFEARLQVNQLYLDVLQIERTKEDLDIVKYRGDLGEISNLLNEIRDDYRNDKDLCQYSFKLLNQCLYPENGPWIEGLKNNLNELTYLKHKRLVKQSSSACFLENRETVVLDEFENANALDPIEMRYQINWYKSCADQKILLTQMREDALKKELDDLTKLTEQDAVVVSNSLLLYEQQLEVLKEGLVDWGKRFDNDLETAEVDVQVSKQLLQKYKEDLRFYTEQEEMMRRRIAEETELMAIEAMARQKAEASKPDSQQESQQVINVAAIVKEIEAVYKPPESKYAKKKKKP